ncbi:radical SAM protein [Ferrimicrobium sp.]|uniref:radical SAM protein n=1 Tax=Ferrimicrobium sp. TaxID=2926050 RepID=UPI002622C395|nr:radical SAM protein [Ferrimicrobium sp.]
MNHQSSDLKANTFDTSHQLVPREKSNSYRVAVCGGPYANPYALSAFIADANQRGCDQLYCLGDLGGFGAEINELWPLLKAGDVQCIAGNYDVAIARGDADCGCGYRDPTDNHYANLIYDYTRTHTTPDFASWMRTLPTEKRFDLGGCDVHLVHGSTLAINDFWWESLSDQEHQRRIEASGAPVICCTHSGLPWQRHFGQTLVVNVGVLGKPANNGRQEVWYAVIEVIDGVAKATLVELPYDWQAQSASMRKAGIPELFVSTIETGWWTTCIEVLPPVERSQGKYHLYRASLLESFTPTGGTWTDEDNPTHTPRIGVSSRPESIVDELPVAPLFGSAYFPRRLWIYTNFHCNLACDYCAVGSSPRALPRALSIDRFHEIVDEAQSEGFEEIYLTGGEPLLRADLTELLRYSTAVLPTVLLTNATIVRGTRFEKLREFAGNPNLVIQTSLDGARAETHDFHRGRGSWARTMEGIHCLTSLGLTLRVAMTATPENENEVYDAERLLVGAGVAATNFLVRPLLQRGHSTSGLEISDVSTVPELTVAEDGLYWHPAGADKRTSPDMVLAPPDSTLQNGKRLVTQRFLAARLDDGSLPRPYRCAV